MTKLLTAFMVVFAIPCIAIAQDGLIATDNNAITPNTNPVSDSDKAASGTTLLFENQAPLISSVDATSDNLMLLSDTTSITPDENILLNSSIPTKPNCAATILANALATSIGDVNESDPEHVIQGWIYTTFQNPTNIKSILNCPEIATVAEDETINFAPIEYIFPMGRRIVVNYATQPNILKQRLLINSKQSLPDSNPSPRVGAPSDSAIWTNTEPAWYGILVVQSGSMDAFIGPDKNKTISLNYLEQNIDRIYPQGSGCTSKSALANDSYMINRAAKKTVNLPDDSNDYYVAGDANLQWITWAEVGLDVAITVATVGGGAAVLGTTKAVRASRAAKNLIGVVRDLEKIDTVRDYVRLTQQTTRAAGELKQIDRVTDAAKYAAKSDEIKRLGDSVKDLEKIDNVRKYKTAATSLDDVLKYRRALKAWKIPQRGNVIARAWRSLSAANTGNKVINKAAKAGRAGMKSGKIRDWLFQSTLRNAGKLAKVEAAGGMIYGAMKFAGDMYDWSETSTGDFTSGVDFKPLGLLSADDLSGQENVVNHGMWLMWAGDSVNPADDDAAYLQAMDFAAKFHQDLEETQADNNSTACSVDIFVVRPIIKNPGDTNSQLYYLIMNDTPWSTKAR